MKRKSGLVVIIRLLLTGWLLFVVWHHAHWSVALVLTLLAIAEEVRTYNQHVKAETEALQQHLEEMFPIGMKQQIKKG